MQPVITRSRDLMIHLKMQYLSCIYLIKKVHQPYTFSADAILSVLFARFYFLPKTVVAASLVCILYRKSYVYTTSCMLFGNFCSRLVWCILTFLNFFPSLCAHIACESVPPEEYNFARGVCVTLCYIQGHSRAHAFDLIFRNFDIFKWRIQWLSGFVGYECVIVAKTFIISAERIIHFLHTFVLCEVLFETHVK